jgi:hypothetical protein
MVLRMPFAPGHEVTSICCTQLPTASSVVDRDEFPSGPSPPVGKRQSAPLAQHPQTAQSSAATFRPRTWPQADSTSEEAKSSPLQASRETSPTDHAQHSQPISKLSQHLRACDESGEVYSSLHNTGRPVSASLSGTCSTQVHDGDLVQSFWPQAPSHDGTHLVCREYLWISSTLYKPDAKSPGVATADHLLSIMHPQLRAFPGSSQMRYAPLLHRSCTALS